MKRPVVNAFTRAIPAVPGRRPLAAVLSPLHAAIEERPVGCRLRLSPMRAVDAIPAWIGATAGCGPAANLLFGVTQATWLTGRRPLSIAAMCDRVGIDLIDRFSDDAIILDDASLRPLLGQFESRHLRLARVEGQVGSLDALAVMRASLAGESPFLVELRAAAAMTVTDDRTITLEVRQRDHALRLLADNFAHYLAALLAQPIDGLGTPRIDQLERLIGITGSLTVRPIETDVFSTLVDVGISTATTGDAGPADRSLIYDVPSATWHDEP